MEFILMVLLFIAVIMAVSAIITWKITDSDVSVTATPKMQKQKFVMAYDPYIHSRIIREFQEWTKPALPFKRKFTDEEHQAMLTFYRDFGWSDVDAEGRVILNGGTHSDGMYYITEEDLTEMVKRLT